MMDNVQYKDMRIPNQPKDDYQVVDDMMQERSIVLRDKLAKAKRSGSRTNKLLSSVGNMALPRNAEDIRAAPRNLHTAASTGASTATSRPSTVFSSEGGGDSMDDSMDDDDDQEEEGGDPADPHSDPIFLTDDGVDRTKSGVAGNKTRRFSKGSGPGQGEPNSAKWGEPNTGEPSSSRRRSKWRTNGQEPGSAAETAAVRRRRIADITRAAVQASLLRRASPAARARPGLGFRAFLPRTEADRVALPPIQTAAANSNQAGPGEDELGKGSGGGAGAGGWAPKARRPGALATPDRNANPSEEEADRAGASSQLASQPHPSWSGSPHEERRDLLRGFRADPAFFILESNEPKERQMPWRQPSSAAAGMAVPTNAILTDRLLTPPTVSVSLPLVLAPNSRSGNAGTKGARRASGIPEGAGYPRSSKYGSSISLYN